MRLIIYDLDGTLVDTRQEIVEANRYVLSHAGASPGRLEREHAEALFATYYAHHANEHSRLYPGAQRVLDYFNERAQAVLTDRPNPFARHLLEALGLSSYFLDVIPPPDTSPKAASPRARRSASRCVPGGGIIAGDSPYPRKPHPAGALALMAKAGARPADTLLIGDSPTDIETGRNSGVFTIAMSHGLFPESELRAAAPDALVEDFGHLLELARRHGW
jgi:HAD superfamily hydrolase (TIGR01509 family)